MGGYGVMKKIFVWVICAVLLLGMARPALAAEEISESALAAVEMSEPVGEEEIAAEEQIDVTRNEAIEEISGVTDRSGQADSIEESASTTEETEAHEDLEETTVNINEGDAIEESSGETTEEKTEKTEETEKTEILEDKDALKNADKPEESEVPQEGLFAEETKTFSDVTNTKAGYYEPVYWATGKGIVAGFNDGTFRPNDTCTRGQIVMFLWRMAGKPEPKSYYCHFDDVPDTHPYRKAIMWANEMGIAQGYSDGRFKPNEPCTRGHIVTFLWRYKGWPVPKTGARAFIDVPKTHVYYKAIMWASGNGITLGFNDGTFRPNDPCTRGQCVTFLYRIAQKLGQKYIQSTEKIEIYNTSPIEVTVGYTESIRINRTPSSANDTLTYTSANTTIATVNSNGVIKGVKSGSTKITVSSPNGKKAAITVKVRDNVAQYKPSTDVYDYDNYDITVEPIKVYYSGNNLVMDAYVVNNHLYRVINFDFIDISVYDSEDNRIATKTFYNISLNLRQYTMTKKSFTFPSPKKTDLGKGIYIAYNYEYYYD